MSLKYRDSSGTETPVAGLNGTSGELVPSVSLYQKGSKLSDTDNWIPGDSGIFSITFATPMPDADYDVIVGIDTPEINVSVAYDKTVNGFKAKVENVSSITYAGRIEIYWQAFKLMTDEVHEADSAHIAQNTANFAPAFSDVTSYAVGDYVTYNNILYRCTTAHTAGVWVAGHFTQVTVGSELSAISYLSRDNLMYHQESGAAVLYNAAYYWQLPSNNTYLVHLTASDKNSPGDNYDGIIKFTYGGTSTTITNITHYRLSGTGSIDAENNSGTLQFSFTSGIPEVCLALLG